MSDDEARSWWAGRRKAYNVGLVIAGILAFVCYVAAFELRCVNTPEAEITLFTTLFQGIGYLVVMGIANLLYNLGYLSERLFKPINAAHYRRITYRAGFWFSVVLPFSIPAVIIIFGCSPGSTP